MQSDYHCLTRSGLDLDISVFLAEAAKAAYGDLAVVNSWAGPAGFGRGNYFDCQNVQGYSCGNEEVALLAFRGTSNIGQWLRDAQFIPARHFWGTVHQGFLEGINSLETDLQAFDQLAKNAKQVWVTGHSLGGGFGCVGSRAAEIQGDHLIVVHLRSASGRFRRFR